MMDEIHKGCPTLGCYGATLTPCPSCGEYIGGCYCGCEDYECDCTEEEKDNV